MEITNWDLQNRIKDVYNGHEMALPLLCFQRAGRGSSFQKPVETSLPRVTPDRLDGYRGAFSETLDIDRIQRWCLQMEFSEFQEGRKAHEYEVFQRIVSRFMQKIDKTEEDRKVYYSSKDAVLMYATEKDAQSIYQLSSGYQIILCMVMELAYRAVLLNPQMKVDASDLTGIVLIDEIEMHLHPQWQWRVLDALEFTFPNIQFIIATHSPMILSSAKDANVIWMISPNEVVTTDSAYGKKVDDVLLFDLHSSEEPEEVTKLYKEMEFALDNDDQEASREIISRAEQKYGENSYISKELYGFAMVNGLIRTE